MQGCQKTGSALKYFLAYFKVKNLKGKRLPSFRAVFGPYTATAAKRVEMSSPPSRARQTWGVHGPGFGHKLSLFRLDVRDEPYNSVLHRQDDLESAKNKRVKVCNSHQMLRKWCGQWWSRTEVFALHLGMIRERLWAGAPAIGGTELPTPQVVSRQREPQCGFGAVAPHPGPGPEVLDSFHRRSSRLLSS